MMPARLAQLLKQKARQLGFTLVGIVLPQAPAHLDVYMDWLAAGRQADMNYLAEERAIERRADPMVILPECRAILVLGTSYSRPAALSSSDAPRTAAYAQGRDYHLVLPERLQALVTFLEEQTGQAIPNRWYTDTGPILERELGMRAGLGWIGKNSCLINPQSGSTFFLAEILLGIELPPDEPFATDQCGTCTRCMQACPTGCILPNRTLDARRCISYLTIENKAGIPEDLRPLIGDWVFGCDICQMVCPWNIRFAPISGDPEFAPRPDVMNPVLATGHIPNAQEFNRIFKDSPVKRAKRRGYLRNLAVVIANKGRSDLLPVLQQALDDSEPVVVEHARWAIDRLRGSQENLK